MCGRKEWKVRERDVNSSRVARRERRLKVSLGRFLWSQGMEGKLGKVSGLFLSG